LKTENIVDLIDVVTKVSKVLDHLSNNSNDEGLSFILEDCRQQLVDGLNAVSGQHI
jgi:hypothetical protein